jgi:hypothetical protein
MNFITDSSLQCIQHTVAGAVANYEIISKYCVLADIKQDYIFTFLVF